MLKYFADWFFQFLTMLANLLPSGEALDWSHFSGFWSMCEGANRVLPMETILQCIAAYFAFAMLWAPTKLILCRMGLR